MSLLLCVNFVLIGQLHSAESNNGNSLLAYIKKQLNKLETSLNDCDDTPPHVPRNSPQSSDKHSQSSDEPSNLQLQDGPPATALQRSLSAQRLKQLMPTHMADHTIPQSTSGLDDQDDQASQKKPAPTSPKRSTPTSLSRDAATAALVQAQRKQPSPEQQQQANDNGSILKITLKMPTPRTQSPEKTPHSADQTTPATATIEQNEQPVATTALAASSALTKKPKKRQSAQPNALPKENDDCTWPAPTIPEINPDEWLNIDNKQQQS